MDLSKKCLVCGLSVAEKLTTTMDIDGHKIALCDTHAEDTPPKAIKVHLQRKLEEIKTLRSRLEEAENIKKQLADELGVAITDTSEGGILIASPKPEYEEEPVQDPAPAPQAPTIPKASPKSPPPKTVKKSVDLPKAAIPNVQLDASAGSLAGAMPRPALNIDATVQGAILEARKRGNEINPASIPKRLSVEPQTVKGRLGQDMTIAKTIRDTTGETTIEIVDTGGDRELQQRAKALDVKAGGQSHFFSSGYRIKGCNMCGGTGTNKITKQKCPKCKGAGQL